MIKFTVATRLRCNLRFWSMRNADVIMIEQLVHIYLWHSNPNRHQYQQTGNQLLYFCTFKKHVQQKYYKKSSAGTYCLNKWQGLLFSYRLLALFGHFLKPALKI